jgi:hypothetical protein
MREPIACIALVITIFSAGLLYWRHTGAAKYYESQQEQEYQRMARRGCRREATLQHQEGDIAIYTQGWKCPDLGKKECGGKR